MKRVYNRYIPEDTAYVPAGREERPPGAGGGGRAEPGRQETRGTGRTRPAGLSAVFAGGEGLASLLARREGGGTLSGVLKALNLGDWDSGDILLLLIILLLLTEGDDLELVIALGLALMMGLGEDGERTP